ncbi:molecular chaperone HtpG [Succinivibrio dextrinosolvens DSM 3072]|uniref:Chaperone protein HtpG n=1 Tax=Succinivibrio dextrinosolvens DSM 3072 TaxID=1123324 RepID=A0A1T4UZX0_9GAMM|nr:molecular chaperone HtpG [Succinivibrio dextrinosolvens]SKA57921.1 molecular chaperone HtpG [Succinivibrio dextrinosolvens DSM 3072]
MTATVHGFQTQVTKLLDLLANSLYSNKEVFLRELISNASDAIDKLHFMSLTNQDLIKDDPNFKIQIRPDKDAKTLTITDNGIGMTLDEANSHLGTIAESGTEAFMKNLTGDAKRDSQLIGQFGVGFYSSFIVAKKVTVITRSVNASEDEGVKWESEGNGTFTSENIKVPFRGTQIILSLKDDETEFTDTWKLRECITKYSDHISTPVELYEEKYEQPKEGEDKKEPEKKFEYTQINNAQALWTRTPKDVKDEEYTEFYKHLSHDYQDPLTWAHNKVEGDLEYTSLLYVPKMAPWDLYNRQNEHGLKLYVQRVFIMDKAEAFLPNYLRFVKGLVDTNALPLNVSRELLQETAVTRKLKKALTKRVLGMLEKLSKDSAKYTEFYKQFGNVLKEGPVEDYDNKDAILKLLRFASTNNDSAETNVSFEDYISRMKEGQDKIYYITAESYEAAKNSPYLEQLKTKGIEVLLMWERVDEWLMGNISEFNGKEFVSANSQDLKLGNLADEEDKKKQETAATENKDLIERFKKALGDKVKDVVVSTRLIDSPSCVISDTNRMMTMQMRRLLEASGQTLPDEKYTLELNPEHKLVQKAYAEMEENRFNQWADLIFEQALLADQGALKDPSTFVKSMNALLLG